MLSKIKKVFFPFVFGILYISFVAQLVYILGWLDNIETKLIMMGILSLEWLILISTRYLSKKSANKTTYTNRNNRTGNNRRR